MVRPLFALRRPAARDLLAKGCGMPTPLEDLDARLRKARGEAKPAGRGAGSDGGDSGRWLGVAFRIGVELVAALIVSVGIGLLIDWWFGTRPWGLIVLFMLGAATGIRNVYRAVGGDFGKGSGPSSGGDNGKSLR
jgi:ATP synthase protein I